MPGEHVDGVIDALERIVDRCASDGDRAGYFAAMYLAVSRTVRSRVAADWFEDGARMDYFAARFAQRYLDAEQAWRTSGPVSDSWSAAFGASARWRPVILQHLLLGMNAHINLDLGVVAATSGETEAMDVVRADFDAINDVLGDLVDACQGALGEVSPWLALCDRVGGGGDEVLINFSLAAARRQAWTLATRLAALSGSAREAAIIAADATAAGVARRVAAPGLWPSTVLLVVRLRERAEPAEVMRRLAAVVPAAG